MPVFVSNPSPGAWEWVVDVSSYVNWKYVYYEWYYYGMSNYAFAGGTYSATVPGGNGSPNPVITWIYPWEWDAGTTFQVSIGGSGFGDAATVDAGPYATVSVQHPNWDEQINATVTVSPDAPSGQQTVTVTSNGVNGMGFQAGPGQTQQTPANGQVTLVAAAGSCVVPVNFRQNSVPVCHETTGVLSFIYTWDSSSGNRQDLQGCSVREVVWYDNGGQPESPPFPDFKFTDPTVVTGPGRSEGFPDNHAPPTGSFVRPYREYAFNARQTYQYKCACQGTEEWTDFPSYRQILIKREVTAREGPWKYVITKSEKACSLALPQ
jgi:hypothetical protein